MLLQLKFPASQVSAPFMLVQKQYPRLNPLSTNPRLCKNKIIHTPVTLLTKLNMNKIKTLQAEYHISTICTRKQVSLLQAGQLMRGLAKHAPSGPSSFTSGHCFNQIQEIQLEILGYIK
jgi:hypothetical protein